MANTLLKFPRILRVVRPKIDEGELELEAQYEVYRLLVPLPKAAQERVLMQIAQILQDRHAYRYED